jgi:transcriptional regulator with XRE-family HTH domain
VHSAEGPSALSSSLNKENVMADVIHIADKKLREMNAPPDGGVTNVLSGQLFKEMREENGILRRQIAAEFKVSVSTVERWENSYQTPVDVATLGEKISYIRLKDPNFKLGKNLCFRRFPIGIAREILELNIDQIAKRYGLSASQWKKIECHERPIEKEILEKLESDIRFSIVGDCI